MLLPQFCRLFRILPFSVLLTASLACTQGGFGQSRSVGGAVPAGSMPVAVDGLHHSTKPRVVWGRDKAPASLTAQANPPEPPNAVEPPPPRPAPHPPPAPQTTTVAPGHLPADTTP